MKKILLFGGGGHFVSVIDSLADNGEYDEIGVCDYSCSHELPSYVKYMGNDDMIGKLWEKGFKYAFITVGSIGNPKIRIKIYEKIKDIGFEIPNIIDKTAVISENVKMGKGIFVGKKAVINSMSNIDDFAIINTGSIVEHNCCIGKFAHIAPGSIICGNCQIGDLSHIGAGATLIQSVNIGKKCVIGAGSLVLSSFPDRVRAFGVPAKIRSSVKL